MKRIDRGAIRYNWTGIGDLEISVNGPRTATLRFDPAITQEDPSEAAQRDIPECHPPTQRHEETRSSGPPSDLRKACESEGN